MRVVASLIAVCLVAAAGARPAAAAPGPWAVEVTRSRATLATLRARVVDAIPPGRTDSSQLSRAVGAIASHASRASGPAGVRASTPDLPAILSDAPSALAPRGASAADPVAGGSLVVALRWFSTHAARGPPIV